MIDGQQRITTLFILLSVLIEKLDDTELKKAQLEAFVGKKGNLKLEPICKDDAECLQEVIFNFDNIKEDEINQRSHRLMYEAKQEFIAYAEALCATDIGNRISFIENEMEVLCFNVQDEGEAVKMFSIINDRGLQLKILDKTKSMFMLYSTIYLEKELNDLVNKKFEKIFRVYDEIDILKEELGILSWLEEETIFLHHYFSAKKYFDASWYNRDSVETVFSHLKDKCAQMKCQKEELRGFISEYLNDFCEFTCAYCDLIRSIKGDEDKEKLFCYCTFNTALYPVIIRLYMQNKLDECLSLLETVEIRVYKLKGTRPISDAYNLASAITENELSFDEIYDWFANMVEKFLNDYAFRQKLSGEIYGNSALKYLLCEFEKNYIPRSLYDDLQIEHIFPDSPEFDVEAYDFKEDYDYEKNKLGNLTLLESKINDGIKNRCPKDKAERYLESKIESTRNIAGIIKNADWSRECMDARLQELIEFCLKRFTI